MRIAYRYFSLFLAFVLLTLPAGAEPGVVSDYGNFTEVLGWNGTQNASQNYYSDSNWTYVSEKVEGYEEETYADNAVENITFLTDTPESELFPVWTADGNDILYTVHRDGSNSFESYKMKANGSEIEQTGIDEGNLTGFSDINLNGTELILTKSNGSQTDLYLVSLENGNVTPVADAPDKSEGWGVWCRLGKKIVYTQKSGDEPSELWIVNWDGSDKIRLGTSENVGIGKDWCPLGLKIIYSANNSKNKPDLWTIEWYGTNQTQLTDTPYGEWNPSYSPDGKRIVYVSDERGRPEVWLRDTKGNNKTRLTNDIGIIDSSPKWSPDGSKIVFVAHNPQNVSDNSTVNNSDIALLNISNLIIDNNSEITANTTLEDNSSIVNNSETIGGSVVNNSMTNNSVVNNSMTNNSVVNGSITVNNSMINGPYSTPYSTFETGSTNSTSGGSDIAAIQLEPVPLTPSLSTITSEWS
ncbi:TolB family protein [Methanosarcina spelaei]|uniref:TolB family protein n=1 Tax=Methanosarcina spelaei TaxID=1036679 RepID=UPI000BAB6A11|nr:TolB family protein [Methanosarcina spelaei]